MGYVLLWIESLAVSLLLVATLAACLAQLGPGPSRWCARGFALLAVGMGALAVVGLVEDLRNGTIAAVLLPCIAVTVAGAGFAVWASLRGPWVGAAAVLIALLPWLPYAASAILVGGLHFHGMAGAGFFSAMAMLLTAYTLGAGWLLVRGLRRGASQGPIRASEWPRGRLAIALLVAAALHLMTFWNLDLAARQQLAGLRAEVGAVALSVAPPRLPDRDNAALVYQQAFEAMGYSGDGMATSLNAWQWEKPWQDAWNEKWTRWQEAEKFDLDLHDAELRQFLKRERGALSLTRQAAAKPGCSFERDYGRPSISMLLTELNPLRTAARLLALEALCRASDKDYRGAVEDVNAMFHIAEHVSADPLLISAMVALSINGLAIDTLGHVLAFGPVPPEDVAAIQFPEGVSYHALLRRAFRMEEATRLFTFQQVGEGQITLEQLFSGGGEWHAALGPLVPATLYRVFLLGDDIAAQSRFAGQMDRAAGQSYAEAKKVIAQYDQQVRFQPGGIVTQMLMPGLGGALEAMARAEAKCDAARLGLALYAYRTRNGRLPDKLDDLAPDFISNVPRDPFGGHAMKFKRSEKGAVVYSIGPDMTDDGGAPYDQKTKTGDITFTLP